MTLQIPVTLESKSNLIKNWGPEVVLKCSCGDRPSHSMWGYYRSPRCPVCKNICQTISHEWGVVNGS
jgi:hypothetical protein